ncbi:Jiraiya [Trinorchestia longiramus]|nr:Jiraiya [Trinorchestia longiramus]
MGQKATTRLVKRKRAAVAVLDSSRRDGGRWTLVPPPSVRVPLALREVKRRSGRRRNAPLDSSPSTPSSPFMSSTTPSPPYLPPQPRDAALLKHLHNGTRQPPHPGVHHSTTTSPPLPHHTPHSTLQSSSSNHSNSTQGGGGGRGPRPGGRGSRPPGGPILNTSGISSKHSLEGNSGSVSPTTTGTGTRTTALDQSRDNSHLTDLSHISRLTPLTKSHPLHHVSHLTNNSNSSSINSHVNNTTINTSTNGALYPMALRNGVLKNSTDASNSFIPRLLNPIRRTSSPSGGLLQTLGLLCLTSLILASLALTFLLELVPSNIYSNDRRDSNVSSEEVFRFKLAGDVSIAFAALTLSLDLFCLLVCSAQFVFAVKLLKGANGDDRAARYLRQSSVSRVCAVTGFFLSVPLLLTGVIIHTFLALHSVPATLMSAFIGAGILLCGVAMIHNVAVWQKYKRKSIARENLQQSLVEGSAYRGHRGPHLSNGGPHRRPSPPHHLHSTSSPLPPTTVDLSATMHPPQELSTLV